MALENLTVSRVCLHEVYVRDDAGNVVQPQYAQGLFQLQGAALNAFRSRVLAAFKSDGHCMEMAIRDSGAGSAVAIGAELLNGANDADFILQSRHFADKLAASQTSQRIPGGVVVVFEGSVGQPANRFFAVMKAELHEAFQKTGNLQARFVSDLFLSKGTKLYKIGLFMDEGAADDADFPDGWSPLLFDQLLTASRRDGAANYFYSNFLGLDIPEDSAHRVKQFFEQTKSYIRSSNLPRDQKVDLFNGLYTYLKVDQSPTILTCSPDCYQSEVESGSFMMVD
ncbi:nucleoid-associated protein [Sphingopyxis sp. 2PD]|uniref:nucleoid-associated protein n=1 Tax=Sphingopyxis sp. 2PD TaxID=2502196 RepID=UPI0010F85810|nr:nucleoid-associated protein [Sphingopyxis sp. 2PD]